jgi:hypothetical protein
MQPNTLKPTRYVILNSCAYDGKDFSWKRARQIVLRGGLFLKHRTPPERVLLVQDMESKRVRETFLELAAQGYTVDLVMGNLTGYRLRKGSFFVQTPVTELLEGDGWFLYPYIKPKNRPSR